MTIENVTVELKEIIEELQSKVAALEESGDGENHLVYPQRWATGDGTESNPWANNCVRTALDNCPNGGTIFLKAGYYKLDTTLWDKAGTKTFSIIGEGMGRTILVTSMTTDVGIFITGVDHCKLEGFTLDAGSQNANTNCGITVGTSDYLIIRDVEVKNSGQTGINLAKNNYSQLQNIYAHGNYSHGVHANASGVSGSNTHNTYRDIYCWDNGYSGFDDYGNSVTPTEAQYNLYDNIQCWNNTKHGIAICNMTNGVVSNSFVSDNTERGMYLHTIEDFNIHNCLVNLNTLTQLVLYNSKNINFANVIVKNGGVDAGGILLKNTSDIRFTTCQSYDDRETLLQKYGLVLLETNTKIGLLNCKLLPNKNGAIHNPNNATIKQCPCNIV